MQRLKLTIFIAGLFIFVAAIITASENRGAPEITVDGGSKGKIAFPHKFHQDELKECMLCHDAFPQEPGVINKMKKNKDLKRKQVMKKVCLKCHKEYKKDGKEHGPIKCNGCHVK